MSFVFNAQSPHFSAYRELYRSYPIGPFVHKRPPSFKTMTPSDRVKCRIEFYLTYSPEEKAYDDLKSEIIWKMTTLFSKHFYDIVNVNHSNQTVVREFRNLIDELRKIEKDIREEKEVPAAGRFHEKDFTPITFNKYSLSHPAI